MAYESSKTINWRFLADYVPQGAWEVGGDAQKDEDADSQSIPSKSGNKDNQSSKKGGDGGAGEKLAVLNAFSFFVFI